ncbi:MAG: SGNH/GDSL hydrolase family protein [Clostridia bacterium]|nr:SGNH/GDSL hydrolase family protein [Clostridia bacterium]
MDFTYEEKSTGLTLETYEWDHVWFEHAPDNTKKRVLLIGDSITCGTKPVINNIAHGEFYADLLGTSKALDNPNFISAIDYVVSQEQRLDAIQFNNGLHGWHLDAKAYEENYRRVIAHIIEKCPGVRVVIALTTPVRVQGQLEKFAPRTEIVKERNEAAKKIASEFSLDVTDLYSAVADRHELWCDDAVHFLDEGYTVIAETCIKNLRF